MSDVKVTYGYSKNETLGDSTALTEPLGVPSVSTIVGGAVVLFILMKLLSKK